MFFHAGICWQLALDLRRDSDDALSCVYYMLTSDSQLRFVNTSCAEVASYINFLESGTEDALSQWENMGMSDHRDWVPESDAASFIADRPDWRTKVLWCGWPVMLGKEFMYSPLWRPEPSEKGLTPGTVERVIAALQTHSSWARIEYGGFALETDLVAHVMNIYEFTRIRHKFKMSLPQIMHCLAHVVSEQWSPHFARDIILASWNQLDRMQQTDLFQKARLLIIVLHDQDHWALMLVLRARALSVLYDGQTGAAIQKSFEKTSEHLSPIFGGKLQQKRAAVPKQHDSWSCGMRVVLHTGFALQYAKEAGWIDLPLAVPPKAVTETKIQSVSSMQAFVPPSCPVSSTAFTEASEFANFGTVERPPKKPKVAKAVAAEVSKLDVSNGRPDPPGGPVQDGEGFSEPPAKKRKVKSKESNAKSAKPTAQDVKMLEGKLKEEHDFTHNKTFQSVHQNMQIRMERGHWQKFLEAMLTSKPLACRACQQCFEMVKDSEAPPQVQGGADPQAEDSEGGGGEGDAGQEEPVPQPAVAAGDPEKRKRGRPKKGSTPFIGLKAWFEQKRAGIYQAVDEEKMIWLCRLCNQHLNMQRQGETFVHLHERRKIHQAKLELFQNGLSGVLPDGQVPERQDCRGINVDVDEKMAPKIFEIRESIHLWMRAGMPFATGEKSSPLSSVALAVTSQGLTMKRTDCVGGEGPLCHHCFSLAHSKHLISDVRRWAWRLDLVQLAHTLGLGSGDDAKEQAETIMSRDYFSNAEHDAELKLLMRQTPADALSRIKTGLAMIKANLLSIPKNRRNASLQALIETRLTSARDIAPRNMERSMFLTLVNKYHTAVENGECHHDQFKLAAAVAAGKLKNEPLIEVLFKSAMSKLCKLERGATARPCTSKFVSSEMAMDMMIVFGRSKASENFLSPLD
eukprot:Skav231285  [mRNA]  locus=scaffold161:147342:150341:+ [translate_table: standard]